MNSDNYYIYIIQNNVRSDGCDYSLDDSPPICGKQVVIATYKVEHWRTRGINISPTTLSQLDIAVEIMRQQFGNAEYVGTAEEERLFNFAIKQSIEIRPKLYLGCVNRRRC